MHHLSASDVDVEGHRIRNAAELERALKTLGLG